MSVKALLTEIYQRLSQRFGKQHWWPARTQFEIIVGAILTQRTTWRNVDLAMRGLKNAGLLDIHRLAKAPINRVQALVRPVGFYRQKAKRIINASHHIVDNYNGSLARLFAKPTPALRRELLSLDGVGEETADSILLYAANRLVFPVDEYTRRIFGRMGIIKARRYDQLQAFFHKHLPGDLGVYKEMRALVVRLGKEHCRTMPKCKACPVVDLCEYSKRKLP